MFRYIATLLFVDPGMYRPDACML